MIKSLGMMLIGYYYANFVLTATHLWVDIIQWPNTTPWRQLFNLQVMPLKLQFTHE